MTELSVYERGLGENRVERLFALGLLISIILICVLFSGLNVLSARAAPMVVVVPDDYSTIQEAINNASDGDTVFVKTGTYYEHVIINKTVSLVGEDCSTTIIDGNGTGIIVHVVRDAVNVTGLSIRESGGWPDACIALDSVKDCVISANIVNNNNRTSTTFVGISLHSSESNTITGNDAKSNVIGLDIYLSSNNMVTENHIFNAHLGVQLGNSSNSNRVSRNKLTNCDYGISLDHGSKYNIVSENQIECSSEVGVAIETGSNNNSMIANTIAYSLYGIRILSSSNNTLSHNSIIDNNVQGYVTSGFTNQWDNGYPSGGNYWSDNSRQDLFSDPDQNQLGSDGVGDTPYTIDSYNIDNYPLMGMHSEFKVISESTVQTISNSTIFDFRFNGTAVSFKASREDGAIGFCRICIPTAVMNATYRVFVNGTEVSFRMLPFSNSTHNYLYFTYSHSVQEVIITPEFTSFLILSFFIITTLIAVFALKRKSKPI